MKKAKMKTAISSGAAGKGSKSLLLAVLFVAAFAAAASVRAESVASATADVEDSKSWTKRVFGRPEWEDVAQEYASPREICRLVEKNVRYSTEKSDQWRTAGETWANGRGDCEDMAILVQELCKISGMETKVHLYFPSSGRREGHAVLVGEWNGKVWFSSNGSYEEVKSEDEVRHRVARMLSCKEKLLWVMKLSERDVLAYLDKSPSRNVATAPR
jgi:predicted transglutaminase-like cysteine proteinase